MTYEQFHNGLRVLMNIDGDEFKSAVGPACKSPLGDDDVEALWTRFRDAPHRTFIAMPEKQSRALWRIVAERTGDGE